MSTSAELPLLKASHVWIHMINSKLSIRLKGCSPILKLHSILISSI